jgi:hypothetical protein
MGKYVNYNSKGKHVGVSFSQKLKALIDDGAEMISEPTEFKEGLVCLVDNRHFAAAGYAFDEIEMKEFLIPCGRNKQWLFMKNAAELAK